MKTKILVLVGIAICTILLTSPALASAGYSKIYGNANEDDTLDMRDVTYIKLAIFGKKPATTFADANHDGKISMLDIGQTKLIILGKEKKLTLLDQADRVVTVPRPIERVVTTSADCTRITVALDACNKLVGRETPCSCEVWEFSEAKKGKICGGRLYELPQVGKSSTINPEIIVSLKPDVIFAGTDVAAGNTMQEITGIPVVCAQPRGSNFKAMYESIELIGKVFGEEKESEELISFIEEKVDKVREVTSQIPEDEKPRLYISSRNSAKWGGFTRTIAYYEPLDIAGGINVAKDCPGTSVDVTKEQIIAWNPEVILLAGRSSSKKTVQDVFVETVLSDPDLQTISAVRNRRVYYSLYIYCCGVPPYRNLVNMMYTAKLLNPDKFEDIDIEEEGNAIYERFLGVDGLFSEYADATGWLREELDKQ